MNLRPWIVAIIVFVGWYALTADWSTEVEPPRPDDQKQEQIAPTPGKIAVLIMEQTEDRAKPENRKYIGVLTSSKVRAYLNDKTAQVDGVPQWRMFDNDVKTEGLTPFWQSAVEQVKGKPLPWIAITNGQQGFAGPLPDNEDDLFKLLKKWGGE